MRIRWRSFELPSRVAADSESVTSTYGRFVVEPFERGFGNTIGNGMRRVLLSSIEGFAITQIKIDGVQHEFSPLDGVREDVVDVVLNVKGVLVRLAGEGPVPLRVEMKKKGVVTAGDIQCPADAEILNPNHVICTLTADREFRLEMVAQRGRGYRTAEENEKDEKDTGVIFIDSNFSPVTRVRYKVEETRVGKMTNFDKLVLEIWTNGAVTPDSALVEAAKIYRKHLNPFVHYLQPGAGILAGEGSQPSSVAAAIAEVVAEPGTSVLLDQPISNLNLSVRARNCLDAENVRTIRQLVKLSEQDLLELRNFGQTSLKEVKKRLGEKGLALAGSAIYIDDGEDDPADDEADANRNGDDGPVLDIKS
ncbi:MAG: DNA-directed RNA polymerase subunit alpha [Planctomycetes bacterium]|nr:DNA-directed RNA polymerase subunit alpha [Planctomycetota bacterium]